MNFNNIKELSSRPVPTPRTKSRDFSKRPVPAPRNILNIKNPEINVPILVPEIVKTKPNTVQRVVDKTVTTINDWMNWLRERGNKIVKKIPPKLKELIEKIKKLYKDEFEVEEGKSALKIFARQFTIYGKPGYVPQTFLNAVKHLIIPILEEN